MPFTFAHPALILPLNYLPKRWFSLTGLVIGSMTPDFEYFIRMNIQTIYSHTFWGIFYFDLPLGILIAFVFHSIVRDSLYHNLPSFLKSRFSKFSNFDFNRYFKKNWIVVLISVIIGAFSHILWDSFTHETGYFVNEFPYLSENVSLFGQQILTYKILQHGSTIIGGLIIVLAIVNMKNDLSQKSNISYKYWFSVLLIFILVLATRFGVGLNYKLYGQVIVTAISAFMIALICTPLLLGCKKSK